MLTTQDQDRIQQELVDSSAELALDEFVSDTKPWKILLLDIFDIISFLIFVTGVVLFTRFFILNPYTIVGASMEPNFHENDFIVVDRLTPRFGELQRGDIIVFVPENQNKPFIKRIIGMPGETVFVKDNGFTICSGNVTTPSDTCNKLPEPYIPSDFITQANGKDMFYVDTGYFAVGDHRGHSSDSLSCFTHKCFGDAKYTARHQDIIGKVMLRLFPNFQKF